VYESLQRGLKLWDRGTNTYLREEVYVHEYVSTSLTEAVGLCDQTLCEAVGVCT
jgi:hypothetical protein